MPTKRLTVNRFTYLTQWKSRYLLFDSGLGPLCRANSDNSAGAAEAASASLYGRRATNWKTPANLLARPQEQCGRPSPRDIHIDTYIHRAFVRSCPNLRWGNVLKIVAYFSGHWVSRQTGNLWMEQTLVSVRRGNAQYNSTDYRTVCRMPVPCRDRNIPQWGAGQVQAKVCCVHNKWQSFVPFSPTSQKRKNHTHFVG